MAAKRKPESDLNAKRWRGVTKFEVWQFFLWIKCKISQLNCHHGTGNGQLYSERLPPHLYWQTCAMKHVLHAVRIKIGKHNSETIFRHANFVFGSTNRQKALENMEKITHLLSFVLSSSCKSFWFFSNCQNFLAKNYPRRPFGKIN